MAFCQKCGQQLPDGANHCPACGTAVFSQPAPQQNSWQNGAQQNSWQNNAQQNTQQNAWQNNAQQNSWQNNAQQSNWQNNAQQNGWNNSQQNGWNNGQQGGWNNGQQRAVALDPDAAANKSIAWLSYLGILILVPLFARKHSDYCKYHVKQGAILCLIDLCYTAAASIILGIIRLIAPPKLTWLGYQDSVVYTIFFWVLMGLGGLALIGLAVFGIVNAASGKKEPLFLLGKIPFINKLVEGPFEMAYEVIRKKP